MSRRNDNRGGQRPTRSYRGRPFYPGYSTDPERDQERGGNWGSGPPTTGNWATSWADEETRYRDESRESRPTRRESTTVSNFPEQFPNMGPSAFAPPAQHTPGPRNPPPAPAPWGPTSMTDRIFGNAMESARGRGPTRGIRPISTASPIAPSGGISLNEPEAPSYSMSRRRPPPEDSSPESNTHSLMERVRRAGVISDVTDRQLPPLAQQIIDDLLFRLGQTEDEKHRLTTKVYDLLKKQRTHQRDDDRVDEEDTRLTKRRDPLVFSTPPSQSPSSSSMGLSHDFGRLNTTTERGPPRPHYTRSLEPSPGPPLVRSEPVRITPPGPLTPDPIVRSDPRSLASAQTRRPVTPPSDDDDSSDETDTEGMTANQKKKHRNREIEREQQNEKAMMNRLDLPLHPFWDVNPAVGYYERDNRLRNMISGLFYVSGRTNVVYHRLYQRDLIFRDEQPAGQEGPSPRTDLKFYKASPQGMPRTAWEVKCLLKLLHNDFSKHYDKVLAFVFLREFYLIARGVLPDIRDDAMNHIMIPGVYDPNFQPNNVSAADLYPRMPDPGKPTGINNVGPENALNIDEMARYAILYGRPGPNFFAGVVMDYAYRVHRRSIFGIGLVRLLTPEGKNPHFRRFVAALFALPRRYREAIEEYDLRNPSQPFVAQTGPTFLVSRLHMPSQHIPNMNLQTIIDLFIENRIPPSWVDHSYPFGLNFIDHQYTSSLYVPFFDEIDNERLARVRAYGIPPPIPEWDGWRHPTDDDISRINMLVAHRAAKEAPGFDHRRVRGWTQVGEDGIFSHLSLRSSSDASRYHNLHPVTLPSYPSLNTTTPSSTEDTHMSSVGAVDNHASTVGPTPMDIETTVLPVVPSQSDEGIQGAESSETDVGAEGHPS